MKRTNSFIAVVLSLALVFGSFSSVFAGTSPDRASLSQQRVSVTAKEMVKDAEYVKDEVIVIFQDSVSDSKIEDVCQQRSVECSTVEKTADNQKVAVAEIDAGDSVAQAISRMERDPRVEYVQPNYQYQASASSADPMANSYGNNQWYLDNIKAREAELPDNNNKTKVAVIDSGADINHEDLKGNLNTDLSKSVDKKGGFTALSMDMSEEGHGTHVSGIIAAVSGNGKGIAGTATISDNNAVELMVIDATSEEGEYLDTFNIVQSIDYAVKSGARVINMSFGGFGRDRVMEEAIASAYANGVVAVCAAGNDNIDYETSPSDFGEVISVCSLDQENHRDNTEQGSSYGIAKDISAPGVNIKSTVPGNAYANYSGTSMASPVVAAGAALVLDANPDLTPAQVKNILCATADRSISADYHDKNFNKYTGYGLIDFEGAVNAAKTADASVQATSIEMKSDHFRMEQEDTYMVETLVLPATSLQKVRFTSNDSSVATVDENTGKVTAIAPGRTVITAQAGSQSTSCNIDVLDGKKVESVAIQDIGGKDIDEITIAASEKFPYLLAAEAIPDDAVNTDISWESDDLSVATVDQNGYVVGTGEGTTTIKASAYNGKSDTVTVHVKEIASDIKIITSSNGRIKLGDTAILQADVTSKSGKQGEDVFDNVVYWYSSNRAVAQIDEHTGALQTKKAGRVTIHAMTAYGASAQVKLVIYKNDYPASAYNLKASSYGYNSNKLSWKAIPNADGYEIWRSSGSGYTKLKKNAASSATSYIDKNLKTGKKYYYKIKAYYHLGGTPAAYDKCAYSKAVSSVPVPGRAKLSAKSGSKKIYLKWTKVSGASGYVIYKYNSYTKKYQATKTIKKGTVLRYTDAGLKKGKVYYYKIKAYKIVSGKKVYGTYSNMVKGRVR